MSSCVFILDEQLDLLIFKNFKSVPNPKAFVEFFKSIYNTNSGPVIAHRGIVYVYVCRDGLFYVSVVLGSSGFNVMAILVYLSDFHALVKKYLHVSQVDRNNIVDNFNLVYELLDESMDFGIPQLTEYNIIREFIKIEANVPAKNEGHRNSSSKDDESDSDHDEQSLLKASVVKDKGKKNGLQGDEQYINSFILRATTQAISWRPKGIYYPKNELFVDVVELQAYLMDMSRGQVRKSFIQGKIICRSYLSGMPKVKMCLNKMLKNKDLFLSAAKFHQCVSLNALNSQEVIEFIPPDGEFQLCEYKLKRHINDPPVIKVTDYKITKREKKQRVQLKVTVEPHFKTQNTAKYLKVHIPVQRLFRKYSIDLKKPPKFKCDYGSMAFNVTTESLLWEAEGMKGGHGEVSYSMQVEFSLFDEAEYKKELEELQHSMDPPPLRDGVKLDELYAQISENKTETAERKRIMVEFEVPYYACSGLKVEYLKIEEEQLEYQSFPWVRYKTVNDQEYAYQI
ncbi:LAME_0G14752g1_1 [Lachancea meyersii CBS 8951]|uniref:LAME_0G14752g1_1 n=1 Tax=Lachancea meyersii CBS 8951 TaxID=1266667 RepID=A0A1G4KAJ1_9SACH|nr:LAME_0G14752g1_1 [Lachancea meyersii CBS 8951]